MDHEKKSKQYNLDVDGDFSHFFRDIVAEHDRDIDKPFPSTEYNAIECYAYLAAADSNSILQTNNLKLKDNFGERMKLRFDLEQFELLLATLKIIDAQPQFEKANHPVRDIIKAYDITVDWKETAPLIKALKEESGVENIHFNAIINASDVSLTESAKTLQQLVDDYLGKTEEVKKIVLEKRLKYREHIKNAAGPEQEVITLTAYLRKLLGKNMED